MKNLVATFKKLNPYAKEFFPSYMKNNNDQSDDFMIAKKPSGEEFDVDNERRRNNSNKGSASEAQRADKIRRTVYVSGIYMGVTEEFLSGLFSSCGLVVDCRICGNLRSVLRFAFVEFSDDQGVRAALSLNGTMIIGYYPVRVFPSRTAILPVNPTFLPRSEDEREKCTRTIYCTNIEKSANKNDVKTFFQSACGEVTRVRLVGDRFHYRRAFVEFAMAESAVVALNCSGIIFGSRLIRVSPSKTPVRSRDQTHHHRQCPVLNFEET